ncbi:MAG: acetylglutamate kinase, partial [Cruoricaptor ignavus]|nr:acetylglutamate kinase [Cruoricaptor ignavus]
MEDLFIIKIGGETIDNTKALENCLCTIAQSGKKIILIHGGGKKVTELAAKLGLEQKMVNGRRITSAETMELCTMIYAGLLNKTIVAKLASESKTAIGLSGADLNCIISEKRKNTEIDYGFVGDIKLVNHNIFNDFISKNIIPVVCAVSLS